MDEKKERQKQTKQKSFPIEDYEEKQDDSDFGGLPNNVDLRRNLGCGG